jgi:hypothetical protein
MKIYDENKLKFNHTDLNSRLALTISLNKFANEPIVVPFTGHPFRPYGGRIHIRPPYGLK